MVDTVEQAVYSLDLEAGSYVAGANAVTGANEKIAASAATVAVAEEKVNNATRLSASGFDRLVASLDPAVKARQQYEQVLQRVSRYEADGLASSSQAAAAIGLATSRYESQIAALSNVTGAQAAYAKVSQAAQSEVSGLAQSTGLLGGALSATGTAGFAVAAGIGLAVSQFNKFSEASHAIADKSEELKRFSETTGLTTNQVQALGKEAKNFGLSTSDIEAGVQRLSSGFSALRDGSGPLLAALQKIGPNFRDDALSAVTMEEALEVVQRALKSTDDTFAKSQLARAAFGRGGQQNVAFFQGFDLSKLNQDVGQIGYGLDENIIKKTTELSHQIENVDKKIQHAFGADFAPFFLQQELGWKNIELSAIKAGKAYFGAINDIGAQAQSVGEKALGGAAIPSLTALLSKGAQFVGENNPALDFISKGAGALKDAIGDAGKPALEAGSSALSGYINLFKEGLSKVVDFRAEVKKPIDAEVHLHLQPLSLNEVQNAVYGSIKTSPSFNVSATGPSLPNSADTVGAIKTAKNAEGETVADIGTIKAQIEAFNQIKGVLGELTPVQDQVTNKFREIALAQQQGIKVSEENVAALTAQTRAQAELAAVAPGTFERQAEQIDRVKSLYPGLTASQAKYMQQLDEQLQLSSAVGGADRARVQQQITLQNELDKGSTFEQASAVASKQFAIAQAQATSQAKEQLIVLQEQLPIINAVTGAERIRAQAAATYSNLIRNNVAAETAGRVAAQQEENAFAQVNAQAQQTLIALQQQNQVANAVTGAERINAQAEATRASLIQQGVDASKAGAIAEQQRANALDQVNANAKATLLSLQDQAAVAGSIDDAGRNAAQAQATYNSLVRQGVSALNAEAVAEQQLANAEAARYVAAQKADAAALDAAQQQAAAVNQKIASTQITLNPSSQFFDPYGLLNYRASGVLSQVQFLGRLQPVQNDQQKTQQATTIQNNLAREQLAGKSAAEIFQEVLAYSNTGSSPLDTQTQLSYAKAAGLTDQQQIDLLKSGKLGDLSKPQDIVQAIQQLQDSINSNTAATDTNTTSTDTNTTSTDNNTTATTDILSALYAQDPRTSHIGFRPDTQPIDVSKLPATTSASIVPSSNPSSTATTTPAGTTGISITIDPLTQTMIDNAVSDSLQHHYGAGPTGEGVSTGPAFAPVAPGAVGAAGGASAAIPAPATPPIDFSNLPTLTSPSIVPSSAANAPEFAGQSPGPGMIWIGAGPAGYWGTAAQAIEARRRQLLYGHSFAEGGIMTGYGPMELRHYAEGGVATSPQLALFGEAATPEAFIPLRGGHVPVQFANDNRKDGDVTINYSGTINVQGNATPETVEQIKRSQYQHAQDLKRMMRGR